MVKELVVPSPNQLLQECELVFLSFRPQNFM
jgi:hypothetical protein